MSAWTDRQWDVFCSLIDEGWHGTFSDETADAWRILLDGIEPEAAVRGLRVLLHEGRPHRPSASEVLAAARRDPSRPTFDEAYRLMFGPGGCVLGPNGGHVAVHPLVSAFVLRQGHDRLRQLPLDDPDYGHLTRRDLRQAWDAHVVAFEGREVAVAALGQGGGDLRQLDPLTVLRHAAAPSVKMVPVPDEG